MAEITEMFARYLDQCNPEARLGALVTCRELRKVIPLNKAGFDGLLIAANEMGILSFHRHDYPASLTQAQKDELVYAGMNDDRPQFVVGVALRRN